jgi:hypothetical protein
MRFAAVFLAMAAAALAGFGIGVWLVEPEWRQPVDPSDFAGI